MASRLTSVLLQFAQDYREVEGVTVLGGEPFDQARELSVALAPVRAAGLSLMLYTGHTIESLRASNNDESRQLLALCDILVDGPFIDELYDESLIWRGSRNQRILCLSERYNEQDIEQARLRQRRALAFSAGRRGDLAISGAQSLPVANRLRTLMNPVEKDHLTNSKGAGPNEQ